MMRENLDYIASHNGKDVLCFGKPRIITNEVKKIESIKKEELEQLAKQVFDWKKATLAIVGLKVDPKLKKVWNKTN